MSKKKTTKDKNLDLQIDFAIDDTRCALYECEKCCVHTYESVPFTAHAAVPYAYLAIGLFILIFEDLQFSD